MVVAYQVNTNVSKSYLKSFSIQADGSLVDTGYIFPFTDTFGAFIPYDSRLIFDWTPLPTSVPEKLWEEFDDK